MGMAVLFAPLGSDAAAGVPPDRNDPHTPLLFIPLKPDGEWGDEADAFVALPGFAVGQGIAAQFFVEKMCGRRDSRPQGRVPCEPDSGQFVTSAREPQHLEHQRLSRCFRTSAVVYALPFSSALRRSSS